MVNSRAVSIMSEIIGVHSANLDLGFTALRPWWFQFGELNAGSTHIQ